MKLLAPILCAGILFTCTDPLPADGAPGTIAVRTASELPRALPGDRLLERLATPVPGVSWKGAHLRDVLREMASTGRIAVIRDRRLDPARPLELSLNNQSQKSIFSHIAEAAGAESRVVGHVVYLGPPEAARVVRTLVKLRSQPLATGGTRARRADRRRLTAQETVTWGDLTAPREVVQKIAETFDLTIENPKQIPHDLWEGGTLPEMTAAEMLTVTLIQFDLTFAWEDGLESIRLVPLPGSETIVVERSYRIPEGKRSEFQEWAEETSPVAVRKSGRRHLVSARIERHEELDGILNGANAENTETPPMAAALARRRFTLAVTGVPARAIMEQLEASGISFVYDAETFEEAGVDFGTPVSMDLKNAKPEEFLAAIFDPLDVDFEFSGTKVRLSLKE